MLKSKALLWVFAFGLAASIECVAVAEDLKQPKLLMNWFAQADQGGFWQAMYDSMGKQSGIDIKTLAGGPRIQVIPRSHRDRQSLVSQMPTISRSPAAKVYPSRQSTPISMRLLIR